MKKIKNVREIKLEIKNMECLKRLHEAMKMFEKEHQKLKDVITPITDKATKGINQLPVMLQISEIIDSLYKMQLPDYSVKGNISTCTGANVMKYSSIVSNYDIVTPVYRINS
ncbi:hypothetical protein BAX94_01020 [Elizabethkingia meningoseptica]|uniref:Uncharacterized protein n=1 Tax=Elizabethkingia meningoseptica TaxID=238 RepID=A0A1T3IJJ5_ELIME|nr:MULTISPECIES: hypothetical protein [Elizabethkingia]AQX12758.1 hypothetical protein BBD35_10415 [Elizabethkingia meningoseptica]MBG0514273.1 hypothetical protein [Elizabethkingia meningoseptica]MDE5430771.1 hypothetical protein [Elizabethkingia meningoseptica]MDE5433189.1 hypothetical protein [Elizabethkingia meningoseptica]MDE5447500.1 hypothetical protein [Elizabethkingia meningoseptica]